MVLACDATYNRGVPDNTWVGVIRMAPACQEGMGARPCDGRCSVASKAHGDPTFDMLNITAKGVRQGLLPASAEGRMGTTKVNCIHAAARARHTRRDADLVVCDRVAWAQTAAGSS
jgi:hypothetical protein